MTGYTDWASADQQAQFLASQVAEGELWAWPVCARPWRLLP